MTAKLLATRDAYGKALLELGREDERIVVLDADLSCSTKTSLFCKEFPSRFINCGVAEQDMIGTAAGLAASGKIAYASTFAVFGSGRAWDQVRISVAYPNLNVKIVVTHGGITVGEDGATHQALEDIALMRVLPNMTVVVPSDALTAYEAVKAVSKINGPAYVRLGRPAVPVIYEEGLKFEIGKSIKLKEGKDVSIIACGIMVNASLEAQKILEKGGISAEVIDMHTIKPIDISAIVNSAKKTGAIVTAEEHSIIGGLGSAVAEIISQENPIYVIRVGIEDVFGESGAPSDLLLKYRLLPKDIAKAAKLAIDKKKKRG